MNVFGETRLEGKPPKSVDEIRALLTSIHKAVEPPPSGPYINGFPETKWIPPLETETEWIPLWETELVPRVELQTIRKPEYYRCLLLHKSANVGVLAGGILGANLGYALPIVFGSANLISLSILLGLVGGAVAGVGLARESVVRKRVDLFDR